MIFPLGLGFKFKRIPVMTLLLCLINFAIYFYNPSKPDEIEDAVRKVYAKENFGTASKNLFQDYCFSEGGKIKPCVNFGDLFVEAYAEPKEGDEDDDAKPKKAKDILAKDKIKPKSKTKKRDRDIEEEEQDRELASLEEEIQYTEILQDFTKKIHHPDAEFTNLSHYRAFANTKQRIQDTLVEYYKKEGLLSRFSITFKSLFTAQFTHGSFMHVFGNMLFLFIFGAYVEQRISSLLFLGVYIVGGSLGLLGHTFASGAPEQFVVGASANVAAIMGLFFVLFFKFRMRFLIWYLSGKTFYAPVSVFFPIMYVATEVLGSVEGVDSGSPVAHLAHLGGMAFGAYMGFMIDSLSPIPWPFLYPGEQDEFEKIKSASTLNEKLDIGEKMIKYNQQNNIVRRYLISICLDAYRAALRANQNIMSPTIVDNRVQSFVKYNFAICVGELARRKSWESAYQLICDCPYQLTTEFLYYKVEGPALLGIAKFALGKNDLVTALRVYDQYMKKFSRSRQAPFVQAAISDGLKKIADTMNKTVIAELQSYFYYHHQTATNLACKNEQPQLIAGVEDGRASA